MTDPVMVLISDGINSHSVFWWRWRTWSKATLPRVRGATSTWADNRGWTGGVRAGSDRRTGRPARRAQ